MRQFDSVVVYSTGLDSYAEREKQQSSPHHRRCIDGKVTGSSKCVGFCTFREHPGYLTQQLRRDHDCIKKSCRYYLQKDHDKEELSVLAVALSGLSMKR